MAGFQIPPQSTGGRCSRHSHIFKTRFMAESRYPIVGRETRRWRTLMTTPPQDRDTLIGMKHHWVSEGTEGGSQRHWCEHCNWKREQSKDQVWYCRELGQLVKRNWLARWWSRPTVIVQWSDTEPGCAPEKRKPYPVAQPGAVLRSVVARRPVRG